MQAIPTTVRVGADIIPIRPDTKLIVDGYDWAWAFVVFAEFPDHPGYFVGSDGSCWSTLGKFRHIRRSPRLLKQHADKKGYRYISPVSRDGIQRNVLVHRLVLQSFVGECPPGLACCHNDGNPANNRIDNLRWDTYQSNAEDTRRHGNLLIGTLRPSAKLNEQDVIQIRRMLAQGMSLLEISRIFGVHFNTISKIKLGKAWGHVN